MQKGRRLSGVHARRPCSVSRPWQKCRRRYRPAKIAWGVSTLGCHLLRTCKILVVCTDTELLHNAAKEMIVGMPFTGQI